MPALLKTTYAELLGQELPREWVLLDSWLDHCSDSQHKPIGFKGEPSYRYFWSTFVQYLKTGRNGTSEKALAWHEVTPEDIAGFLNSGPSSRKRGTNVSDITRRRYWRLLERIYDHAMARGWIASNPARMLVKEERPKQEDPLGAIVSPRIWEELHFMVATLPVAEPVDMRNRAVLACLVELGLMPMEIRSLAKTSVLFENIDGMVVPRSLRVTGPGKNQDRTLELPLLTARALQEWLAVRELYKHPEGGDALFCTNRRPTEKTGGMMTAITLLLLVREWITLAAQNVGEPVPARLGPQILRNTWIYKQLISGMHPNEVVLRAGLKNAKSFAHLRIHLPADIRLVIANARDDRV